MWQPFDRKYFPFYHCQHGAGATTRRAGGNDAEEPSQSAGGGAGAAQSNGADSAVRGYEGIGARRRTCRQLVLSLISARRAAQVAEELRDDEARREGLAQEDRVLAQIRKLAIIQPTGPRYRPVIEGESFPEATDLTARMLEPCYPGLAGTRSFYRSYSAVLHGQLYGLMNFMTPAIQDDGSILLSWQLRGSVLYGAVEVALLSFREPFKRISQHMGWGRLEYDLWLTRVGRSLDVVTRRGSWG